MTRSRPSTTSRCRLTSSSTTCASGPPSSSRRCPRGQRCSTSAAAPERWPRGSPRAGYEVTGVDPSEGMLEVLRGAAPASQPCAASGPACRSTTTRFDLVYCVAVMHHIADPDAVRQTLAEMVQGRPPGRPHPDLGPQPAQPVLGAADGAGAPGHRRGAADQRAGDRRRAAGGRRRDPRVRQPARAWCPISRPRAPAARPPRSSACSSARRTCAGFAAHNVMLATKPQRAASSAARHELGDDQPIRVTVDRARSGSAGRSHAAATRAAGCRRRSGALRGRSSGGRAAGEHRQAPSVDQQPLARAGLPARDLSFGPSTSRRHEAVVDVDRR